MSDDLQRFKETYITECYELLEDMEEKLLGLDEDNPDPEDLNAIFRCAHSIKGGSGAFNFNRITKFTHILEELLDGMREGKLPARRESIDALLESADIVKQMVSAAQAGTEAPEGIEDDLVKRLLAISGGENPSGDDGEKEEESDDPGEISIFDISFVPNDNLFITGNEPLLIFKELKSLGNAEIIGDMEKLPALKKLDPEQCYVSWKVTLETEETKERVEEVFEFVEDDCDLKIDKIAGFAKPVEQSTKAEAKEEQESEKPEADSSEEEKPAVQESPAPAAEQANSPVTPAVTSVRVDIDKIDNLVNMVGEIVIAQAMISAQASKLQIEEHAELLQGISTFSQYTVELQEAVMAVRMQPVKSVFSRMPRIVRDLSSQLGKDIVLETYGENTELDKTVIEQLSDPLTHMIRNSVDHGIDDPESRKARGKDPQGIIKLSADHAGGKIVLKIEDNGRGINREKVFAKAKEKGLVPKDAELSDKEIDNLIFMAGFSTAETVSNISGRGVGMDVVRRNIEALGGTINVMNYPEEGTSFIVTLPLTLAILDGMVVRVGTEKYIIPIGNIIETMRPAADEVRKIADANDLINVRGEFISILYLHKVFNISGAKEDASRALVVLVENGLEKFGLVVDELIGQQQVVIKSLEENTAAIPGISAATILGDGKVSLILDMSRLQSLMLDNNKNKNNEELEAVS